MLTRPLKRMISEHNWVRTKNRVQGEWKGYWFNMADEWGFKTIQTVAPLSTEQRDHLSELLRTLVVGRRKPEYTIGERHVTLIYRENLGGVKHDELLTTLDKLVSFFQEVGIPVGGYCGECGYEGAHPVVALNATSFRMCSACFNKLESELNEAQREFAYADYHYTRGAIGALLGGMVASIPWIIVDQLGFVASILGLIIGKGALMGYGILGGKRGVKTRWIIVGATLGAVFAAHLVSLGLFLSKYDFEISFYNFVILFTEPDLVGLAWGSLGMGVVMAMLGISSIFTALKNEVVNTIPVLKKLEA